MYGHTACSHVYAGAAIFSIYLMSQTACLYAVYDWIRLRQMRLGYTINATSHGYKSWRSCSDVIKQCVFALSAQLPCKKVQTVLRPLDLFVAYLQRHCCSSIPSIPTTALVQYDSIWIWTGKRNRSLHNSFTQMWGREKLAILVQCKQFGQAGAIPLVELALLVCTNSLRCTQSHAFHAKEAQLTALTLFTPERTLGTSFPSFLANEVL